MRKVSSDERGERKRAVITGHERLWTSRPRPDRASWEQPHGRRGSLSLESATVAQSRPNAPSPTTRTCAMTHSNPCIDKLFRDARTHNAWLDKPINDDT